MSRKNIHNYTFNEDERLFFDANVWIYIYGPLIDKKSEYLSEIYSKALEGLLFVDALVLSEFINTYARLEYTQRFTNIYQTFKKFRQSSDFKSVAEDIANNAKRILKLCQLCDLEFSTVNLMDTLSEYAQGKADYNDQLIAEICIDNDFTLVTHDADFLQLKKSNQLIILTANKRLLNV